MTDLAGLLEDVERGEYPPADFGVTHVSTAEPYRAAVLGFTGHTIVAADVPDAWLAEVLPPDDPGAAFNPPFLRALEQRFGLRVNNIDILTLAGRGQGQPLADLTPVDDQTHPRVRRALRYRQDVKVWTCPGGVLVLGRGLGGRWEVAVEVEPAARGKGLGRRLAQAATRLVPEERALWAQVGVGNAASLRAFLAAGYVPVGEEALLVEYAPGTNDR